MILKNSTYDRLKNTALIIVPLIAFLSTICEIWNVPHSQEITATLVAIDTLLGAIVKIASSTYNKKKEAELEEAKNLNGQNLED